MHNGYIIVFVRVFFEVLYIDNRTYIDSRLFSFLQAINTSIHKIIFGGFFTIHRTFKDGRTDGRT